MDYEKEYKRAIEVAKRKLCVDKADMVDTFTPNDIYEMFPELKEDEDERIRKEILDCFKAMKQQGCFPSKHKEQYDSWVAYLEKQGQTFTKKDVDNAWIKGMCDAKRELEKQGENISLPKFTFDDVLALQCAMEAAKKVQKDKDLYEQLKSLHDRLHDAYWLEKQGEQKPTWSEDDEQLYNDLSDTYFYNDEDYPEETYKLMLKRVLDWMTKRAKFLRPQNRWKPSEEQLRSLARASNRCVSVDDGKILVKLLEQLKKLMEK